VTKLDDPTDSNILYFPHIEIADANLLKGALCVWDVVYRIVPAGYQPKDSDEVREAVESGRLRDIQLTSADLMDARKDYVEFLKSLPFLPDALDQTSVGEVSYIHREKLDQVMIQELSDILGVITRNGDWLGLPRGVADGYLLFLSNSVSKRRGIAKFTDSDSIFVAMQYFAVDGNIGSYIYPTSEDDDVAASLILKAFVPDGIEEVDMRRVLKFCEANRDGREAFRGTMTELAERMTKIDDPEYLRDLVEQVKDRMEESGKINLARIREHFTKFQPLLIYLGLPLASKVLELISGKQDPIGQIASFGVAGIAALADIAKSGRSEWVARDATYYCKLRQQFDSSNPIPREMRSLDRMMEEFIND
jgi:hypothetical protein